MVADPRLQRIVAGLKQARETAAVLPQRLGSPSTGGRGALENAGLNQAGENLRTQPGVNYARMSSESIVAYGPILSLLTPGQRSDLVKAALGIKDPTEQAIAIASLASGFEHLHKHERSALVEATLKLEDGLVRGIAIGGEEIGGIGEALEHLEPGECSALVENVSFMVDDGHRAIGVASLAPGFKYLKSQEVADLVGMICDPQHPKALGALAGLTIGRLGPGIKHLESLGSDRLAKIIEVISDPNHGNFPSEGYLRAVAIGGLGPGLEHFTPGERTKLFRMISDPDHPAALTDPEDVGTVIAGWGAGIEHFEPNERRELFKMISDPNHPRALTGKARNLAISGMGDFRHEARARIPEVR